MNLTEHPFISDMTVRPELVGLETLLIPFLQYTSTQRGTMFCSNVTQALLIDGREQPRVFTGWENLIGEYEFDHQKREDDAFIVAVIPKFEIDIGLDPIFTNPEFTVIYTYDNKADYFQIKKYENFGKFGYSYKWQNMHMCQANEYVPKDIKFSTSTAHENGRYMLGTNANTCYMSIPEVAEDAFVISQNLADKLSHLVIEEVEIDINLQDVPLNLYGNEEVYKSFPDVGNFVNDEGILMAIRKPKSVADIADPALMEIQYMHDDIFTAPPNAEIINVEVHIAKKAIKNIQYPTIYSQFTKYAEQHKRYDDKVISTYESLKRDGFELTPKLNNLITRSLLFKEERKNKKIRLVNKKDPIEFVHLKITYAYKRKIHRGYKLTDRMGSKGVVSDVWPTEDMPVDKYGIRADIIINPDSPYNRMNFGQNSECFIGRAMDIMTIRLRNGELGNDDKAYSTIMQFIKDIRPKYAELIASETKTIADKQKFLSNIRREGMYMCIPPFYEKEMVKVIPKIEHKYDIHDEVVTYNIVTNNGKKTIQTEEPICIGSKYIYLLGKIPLDMMTCVEMAHVSQFMTPTRSKVKSIKAQDVVKATPIKLGEDETSVLNMSIGPDDMFRIMSLYSSSPSAVKKLQELLIENDQPSALANIGMDNKELIENNVVITLFRHMLGVLGITYDGFEKEEE